MMKRMTIVLLSLTIACLTGAVLAENGALTQNDGVENDRQAVANGFLPWLLEVEGPAAQLTEGCAAAADAFEPGLLGWGSCAGARGCADINAGNYPPNTYCPAQCRLDNSGACGFCMSFQGTCTCTV